MVSDMLPRADDSPLLQVSVGQVKLCSLWPPCDVEPVQDRHRLSLPTSLSLSPMSPAQPVLLAPGKDTLDDALFLTSTPVDVSGPFEYSGHGERVRVDEPSFACAPSAPSFFLHEHPACDCYCYPNTAVVIAQPDATVASCNQSIPTSDNAATDVLTSDVVGSYRKEACATLHLSTVQAVSFFFHDQTW